MRLSRLPAGVGLGHSGSSTHCTWSIDPGPGCPARDLLSPATAYRVLILDMQRYFAVANDDSQARDRCAQYTIEGILPQKRGARLEPFGSSLAFICNPGNWYHTPEPSRKLRASWKAFCGPRPAVRWLTAGREYAMILVRCRAPILAASRGPLLQASLKASQKSKRAHACAEAHRCHDKGLRPRASCAALSYHVAPLRYGAALCQAGNRAGKGGGRASLEGPAGSLARFEQGAGITYSTHRTTPVARILHSTRQER